MALISPLKKEFASPEAQTTLAEIEKVFGRIPNLFLTMAHFPPLLQANWQKYQAVMLKGSLSRQGKETIALLVSQDNGCNYCVLESFCLLNVNLDTQDTSPALKRLTSAIAQRVKGSRNS